MVNLIGTKGEEELERAKTLKKEKSSVFFLVFPIFSRFGLTGCRLCNGQYTKWREIKSSKAARKCQTYHIISLKQRQNKNDTICLVHKQINFEIDFCT